MSVPERSPFGARTRLSTLFGGVFLLSGAQAPFLPVWLAAKGFSLEEIGWLLAMPRAMQVVSLPIAARSADRGGRVVGQLFLACVIATGCFFALPFFGRGPGLIALLAILFLALNAAMPLLDVFVYSLPPENGVKIDFGSVRKWGSVAFVSGNLLGGLALNLTGALSLPSLLGLAGVLAMGACAFAAPLDDRRTIHRRSKPAARHAIGAPLLAVIGVETLVMGSHSQLNAMASLHWSQQGFGNVFIGGAWAIGVVAESIAFGVLGRIFGPGSGRRLLVVGASAAAFRWSFMAFDPPGLLVYALQTLHGLTFAATHFGAMELVAEFTPASNRSFTQGSMIAASSGFNALLAGASGALQAELGQAAYVAMLALALSGLALIAAIPAPAPPAG